MKTVILSTRQFAMIKRTAQNVNPMVSRKNTLAKRINEMTEEMAALDAQIAGFEGGIKAMCAGCGTEQLVKKVVTPTDKTDKDGRQLTKTEYVPSELLSYNEEKNEYVLNVPEEDDAQDSEEAPSL